jgi:hypothetical protein
VAALFAIGGITILEVIALLQGIDGAILMLSLALLGGLGGYKLKGAHVGRVLAALGTVLKKG